MKTSSQAGETNPLLIANVVTGALVVILSGLLVWTYLAYSDAQNRVDEKVGAAVTEAKKQQTAADEKRFLEQEKLPTRQFQGPADLGSVTFQYPKTWSAYIAKNVGAYEAYLHPNVVPTLASSQPYALRVLVEDKTYDSVIKAYDAQVKKGDLRSNPATVKGFSGIRLDGKFTKEREGSAVIFKVRDKTLTLATDSTTFKTDFDNTILTSLDFNP